MINCHENQCRHLPVEHDAMVASFVWNLHAELHVPRVLQQVYHDLMVYSKSAGTIFENIKDGTVRSFILTKNQPLQKTQNIKKALP